MFPTSLLAALLVSLTILRTANGLIVRKPPVTLALSRQFNATGLKNLYQHDRNRPRFLKARGSKREYKPTPQDSALTHIVTVVVGDGICKSSYSASRLAVIPQIGKHQTRSSSTLEDQSQFGSRVHLLTASLNGFVLLSSNTWIGAGQPYQPRDNSQDCGMSGSFVTVKV